MHTFAFHRQKLWWIPGNDNFMSNANTDPPVIASVNGVRDGRYFGWDVQAGFQNFNVNTRATQYDPNNISFSIFYTWVGGARATHVGMNPSPGAAAAVRLLYHATYGVSVNSYFDVGNAIEGSGRIVGNRPSTNYKGFHYAQKSQNTSSIYFRGLLLEEVNTMATNLTLPDVDIKVNGGSGWDSIAGFCFGRSMPPFLVSAYSEQWEDLMRAIQPFRVDYTTNSP